jgi:hypothetical protein
MVTTTRKFVQSGEARTQAEAARRARAIAGTDAEIAVAFLNLKKGRAVQHVRGIRQELADLTALADSLRGEMLQRMGVDAWHRHLARRQGFVDRLLELNRQLAAYAFVPMLACLSFETYEWRYQATPKITRGPTKKVSDSEGLIVTVDECQAAAALARLFARGELHTVHLCDNCVAVWHVAARSIDRFCGKRCREEWHTKSPKYAEKRREIQRNYRKRINLRKAAEDAALKGRK